jgi:hypothetical protein
MKLDPLFPVYAFVLFCELTIFLGAFSYFQSISVALVTLILKSSSIFWCTIFGASSNPFVIAHFVSVSQIENNLFCVTAIVPPVIHG